MKRMLISAELLMRKGIITAEEMSELEKEYESNSKDDSGISGPDASGHQEGSGVADRCGELQQGVPSDGRADSPAKDEGELAGDKES
jgi:hypothetical protein